MPLEECDKRDADAPLRLVVGHLLGQHEQTPKVREVSRWLRAVLVPFLGDLHVRQTGQFLVTIRDGQMEVFPVGDKWYNGQGRE